MPNRPKGKARPVQPLEDIEVLEVSGARKGDDIDKTKSKGRQTGTKPKKPKDAAREPKGKARGFSHILQALEKNHDQTASQRIKIKRLGTLDEVSEEDDRARRNETVSSATSRAKPLAGKETLEKIIGDESLPSLDELLHSSEQLPSGQQDDTSGLYDDPEMDDIIARDGVTTPGPVANAVPPSQMMRDQPARLLGPTPPLASSSRSRSAKRPRTPSPVSSPDNRKRHAGEKTYNKDKVQVLPQTGHWRGFP